uniref:Uncharacterized protein n=1 Tax=Cannabis sativa TaxID=3483 RepID=A0A803QTH2_CANSA
MRIWNFLILHMSNVEIWKLKRKSRRRLSNLLVGLRNTPTKRVRFMTLTEIARMLESLFSLLNILLSETACPMQSQICFYQHGILHQSGEIFLTNTQK